MATIEKKQTGTGARFRARIRRAGMPELSATFPSKGEAREWAIVKEAELRASRYSMAKTADQHKFTDVLDRYTKTVLPRKSTKARYIAQQRAQLHWWRERLQNFRLSDVTTAKIAMLRDELAVDRGNATVNRYLAALSHVFTKAVKEWEMLDASPMTKLEKMKESRGRARYLTDPERKALLAAAAKLRTRKPLITIIVLAITTGARKGELLGLQWRDVDFDRGMVTVRDTKNGEQRALYVSGYAWQLLLILYAQRHPRSGYIFPARCGTKPLDIDSEFNAAVQAADITDFHFHDLRHTAASYMAMHGAQHTDIAEVLGHKSLAMVKRYAHMSKTHVAGVMASVTAKTFPMEGAPA